MRMNNIPDDKYIVKDGKLRRLWQWGDSDELYVPDWDGRGKMELYQEHLDGPTLDVEEARKVFPEYFL